MLRKRAKPAKDLEGKATFGFRREFDKFYLPHTREGDEIAKMVQRPDLDLEVQALPDSTESPLIVDLTVEVDASGKATACEYSDSEEQIDFASAACFQAKQLEFDKLVDPDGSPISYVRSLKVGFSLARKS